MRRWTLPWLSATATLSCEIRTICLAGHSIRYRLKRSAKRRTIALQIGDGGLEVRAPFGVSDGRLVAMLHKNALWVLAKLHQAEVNKPPPVSWDTGAALPLRGATIYLHLQRGRCAAALRGNQLQLTLPDADNTTAVHAVALQWYRDEALTDFLWRTRRCARRLGMAPTRVSLSNAKTRWGSCSATGVVRLNWRLVKAPSCIIDYVVAHELAHLVEHNHSSAFWQVVARLYPAYREARHDLRHAAAGYHAF